jgi:predicted MFS family arabinose efflux permease
MSYMQELYAQFKGFPRTVKLFYGTDILFGFAQAIWGTLFNLHMLDVGFTADHIGQLQSLAAILMAALAIPVGLAADRWGRRWFYVAGSILFGAPYALMPWVDSFPALMLLNAVYTIGNTLMMVNEAPLLAGEVGPDRRASVFSFMMINFFVWNTLGIQLAGFLSKWLPAGPATIYQWPLVIAGVCAVASGVTRAFLPFQAPPATRHLTLRPTRTSVMLGLVNVLSGAFGILMFSFGNVILAERFAFAPDALSTVLTLAGVVGWAGSLAVPWTSRRMGDLKAYTLVMGLQGLVLFYMGVAAAPGPFLAGFMGRALLSTMQMSLFNAFAMGVTPESERATANSYAMVGRNIGNAVAAKGFGVALAAGNYFTAFSLAGALAVSAAVFTLLAFRRREVFGSNPTGA